MGDDNGPSGGCQRGDELAQPGEKGMTDQDVIASFSQVYPETLHRKFVNVLIPDDRRRDEN